MVFPIRISGTGLEIFSARNIALKHDQTLWKLGNRHFQLFSGDFVWGFYEGILIGKCQFLVHDPGFWPAARHPRATFCFSMPTNDLLRIIRFLDSWHRGAFAAYRFDQLYQNISVVKFNNLMYFRQVWRLLGGFYTNLTIIKCVTRKTLGCKAIFP